MPNISYIKERPANRSQNYYIVGYDNGIFNLEKTDSKAVVEWLAVEENTLTPADSEE